MNFLKSLFLDNTSPVRLKTLIIAGISLLLAIFNAGLSAIGVALAVPGTGEVGPGFTVISITFVAGNLLFFGSALFLSRNKRWGVQVLGLFLQLLTLPICIAVAMLVMFLFGVDRL